MNNNAYLESALKKVTPLLKGEDLIVSCSELKVVLNKESFIETLLEEYQTIIEEEIDEEEDKRLGFAFTTNHNFTFDTDFAGSKLDGDGSEFKIQEDKEVTEHNKITFEFFFWHPQTEKEKEDEAEPKRIDIRMNWFETKIWCEYLLRLAGKENEVSSMKKTIKDEREKDEKASQERSEKTSTSVAGIDIYPNSSLEYHSVWISSEEGIATVPILVLELEEIALFLEDPHHNTLKINNVYGDEECVILEWDGDVLHLTLEDDYDKTTVELSKDQAKQLSTEITRIEENSSWI